MKKQYISPEIQVIAPCDSLLDVQEESGYVTPGGGDKIDKGEKGELTPGEGIAAKPHFDWAYDDYLSDGLDDKLNGGLSNSLH